MSRDPEIILKAEFYQSQINRLNQAIEDRDELQRVFDLQWKADKRAIKRWQAAHPGNDMVWPDRTDMVVWLMEQYDAHAQCAPEAREKEITRLATIEECARVADAYGASVEAIAADIRALSAVTSTERADTKK